MKTLVLLATLALTTVFAAQSFAHDDHNHEAAVEAAPHGGLLRDAPPYKAELVLNKEDARVFVFDKDMKPVLKEKLSQKIQGTLAFPKDKKRRIIDFELKGDAYEAKITGIDKVHRYDLHVTLVIDKKSILADFGIDNIH